MLHACMRTNIVYYNEEGQMYILRHKSLRMSEKLKFYCAWFCPFAQRAWIALLEKKLPYEYIEYNPYKKKTPEFLSLNPRGLVPVLEIDGQSVYESDICVQYIDESGPEGIDLLPKNPMQRAKVRVICEYITREIVPLFYGMLLKQDNNVQEMIKAALLENLKTLMTYKSNLQKYLSGNTFGMADIMLVPFTTRFPVLQRYRQFDVPQTEEYKEVHDWMNLCHQRESVVSTLADMERIISVYRTYADGTATVRSKF